MTARPAATIHANPNDNPTTKTNPANAADTTEEYRLIAVSFLPIEPPHAVRSFRVVSPVTKAAPPWFR